MTQKYICTDDDFQFDKIDDSFKIVSISLLSGNYPCQCVRLFSRMDRFRKYLRYFICINHLRNEMANSKNSICIFSTDVKLDINDYKIKKKEVVLPLPIMANMEEAFSSKYDLEDLKICESIIDELYPKYTQPYDKINGQYPVGAFVMHAKDFKAYCDFVYNVMAEFFKKKNLTDDNSIDNYLKSKGLKGDEFSDFIIVLIEKISTIFYMTYFKDYSVTHAHII